MSRFPQFRDRSFLIGTLLSSSLLLAACGGGSGGSDAAALSAPDGTATAQKSSGSTDGNGNASPTTTTRNALRWSDRKTWGGSVPGAGAQVVIPAGQTILLDVSTAALGALRIDGTLVFDRRDLTLSAHSIELAGALLIGSADAPFVNKASITLTGSPLGGGTNDGVSRGLLVQGGRLELIAAAPSPVWSRLGEHAEAGSRTLTLKDSVNWRAGDTIAVAPSDYYGVAATQRLTLSAANGAQLSTQTALEKFRWGKLQYVTQAGMSLVPDASYVPPATPAPTVLDERAAVANLSRNIVIQGADDAAWQTSGFGAHLMIMDLKSRVVVDGVEFRRVGQAGVTGRYPFHWHLLSYSSTGALLGDASGHVLRNSAIWASANRCVVVHGTNGVQVLGNVCQDIRGHAFFLEDAVERRNVFDGNLALTMRSPAPAQLLQKHEGAPFEGGPSGFWLTNPDNTVRNNLAGDAQGNGFWMAFPKKPLGLSKNVAVVPHQLPMGTFERNTAHTTGESALLLEHAPIDDAGTTEPTSYGPRNPDGSMARHTLSQITAYKSLHGAYRNRGSGVSYSQWVSADNVGTHMAGSSDNGVISNGLFIGTSLNHLTPYPDTWRHDKPAAFATYNSSIDMRDNTIVNFPFIDGQSSGAWSTSDYYFAAVNKGTARNPGNRLIGASGGYRTLPPHLDGKPIDRRFWTLSGALWDPHGYSGKKEQFWVYDVPFLTTGATCQDVAPAGKNGKSCDGQYYGVGQFNTDFDTNQYQFTSPIDVTRVDAAGNPIGNWSVQDGSTSTMLGWMRHFAARQDGRYILRFPGKPAARYFGMDVSNAFRSTDSFLFAVQFDASVNAAGYTLARSTNRDDPRVGTDYWSRQNSITWFSPATSLDEVAASSGNKLWQDRANNLVWIKFQGGLPYAAPAAAVDSDQDLYRTYGVVLHAVP
jgi:hypothetical protein